MSKIGKLVRNPSAFFKDAAKKLGAGQVSSVPVGRLAPGTMKKLSDRISSFSLPISQFVQQFSLSFTRIGNRLPDLGLPSAYMLGFLDHKSLFYANELSGYNAYGLKLPVARQLMLPPDKLFRKVRFKQGDVIVVWGRKDPGGLSAYAKKHSVPIHRVEDAFIRSIDLGGVHGTPLSYIYDRTGIYFDAEQPSDLETLLNEYDFKADETLLMRARACIERMVESGAGKHNFTDRVDTGSVYGEKTKKRVLVIGQVEDDASIRYGCSKRIGNNELVIRAGLENPDAQIIFKPHPDVIAGLRRASSDPGQVESIAQVLYDSLPIADALETIDHVYTISSLDGFEALLRGINVTTFGAPFYSGWGLTDDRQPEARRKRTLTVEEVFAAAYILYPRYLNPFTKERIEIEEALELLEWMKTNGVFPNDIHDDERVSNVLIKRSEKALQAGDVAEAMRLAYFAVSANSSPSAYVHRARVNLKAGIFGEAIERDFLLACNLSKWDDPDILMAYAKYLWEFFGNTSEFHQLLTRIRKLEKRSSTRQLTLAAMLNSCGFYEAAIEVACEAAGRQTDHQSIGYIELSHTLNQALPGAGLGASRASDLREIIKSETLRFAHTILDSKGDFCVVGNSPKEIGSGNGARIDSHKTVIRFNAFSLRYPFYKDYGSRTDVWVRMPRNIGLTDRVDPSIKQLIIGGSNWQHRMADGAFLFERLLGDYGSVGVVPFDVYKRLVYELKSVPSSGLQMLYWIYSLTGPIPIERVYGFELTDQPKNKDRQYGATTQRVVRHDWEKERAFFELIISR
ncbi:MAG: glycosyltransferase family 29 protein [Syntrophobacteraceae bacterium]